MPRATCSDAGWVMRGVVAAHVNAPTVIGDGQAGTGTCPAAAARGRAKTGGTELGRLPPPAPTPASSANADSSGS